MTIRNIRTGIPLRVWDILGAGGFLLTNFQVELPDYFENGKDIVYYEDINKPEKEPKKKPENDFVYRDIEDKMKRIMGTKVVIKNKDNNKGKIEIDYYSKEELERIYDMIRMLDK